MKTMRTKLYTHMVRLDSEHKLCMQSMLNLEKKLSDYKNKKNYFYF